MHKYAYVLYSTIIICGNVCLYITYVVHTMYIHLLLDIVGYQGVKQQKKEEYRTLYIPSYVVLLPI